MTRVSRFVAPSLALAVLAGCGVPVAGSNLALRSASDNPGVEASKATLAKRLIVGFQAAPNKAAIAQIEKASGTKHVRSINKLALAVFEAPDARKARKILLATDGVDFVEGELLPEREPINAQFMPFLRFTDGTDPGRKDQWYLEKIGAPKVWDAAKLKPVLVGLIDTGVDLKHPDLKPILVEGYNSGAPGQPPQDQAGHGTMTAGCIAAAHNNGIGIAGTANNAKIMPIKVGNGASTVVDAMMYAADHGVDLISMSLSFKPGMADYPAAIETTKRAAQYVMSKSIPMICSMGNTGNSQKNVPSAFAGNDVPNLIAVGATDQADKVTSFSTYGSWTSVAAPGRQIITTSIGGGTSVVDGTSFSTPITAGVVAMMLGNGIAKDPGVIKAKLLKTAVDIDAPGKDDKSGAGRIDAFRAVME